jgi:predicted transcriptional regulator
MPDKGQIKESRSLRAPDNGAINSDFVLDKVIFSNVFEKDIRRIYIYRKSERLAKAIHLITPGFRESPALRNRLDSISVGLIDAAILPPLQAKEALSRELLAFSSLLAVARVGGFLSEMNADVITREAHILLHEIASYEEPRLLMDEAPSLAELAKRAPSYPSYGEQISRRILDSLSPNGEKNQNNSIGHKGQTTQNDVPKGNSSRQESIVAILQNKGPSYIKDISMVIRDISEKTIQRELQSLVSKGVVNKSGERRWTQYSLV